MGEISFALLSSDSFRWREGLCWVFGETERFSWVALISDVYFFFSLSPAMHTSMRIDFGMPWACVLSTCFRATRNWDGQRRNASRQQGEGIGVVGTERNQGYGHWNCALCREVLV